jgi:hypothetical protein
MGTAALSGIDLISEHRVGIYDVSVIRSDNADDLIDWLNQHNFKFEPKDTAAFDSYISQGWCFVVATINPSQDEDQNRITSQGLAAPLILRFPHPTPIYPLALTATGGFDTEILIYLASPTKMTCNDRLPLRFAGQINEGLFHCLTEDTDPEGFFDPNTMTYPHLCKFKATLTPNQMTQDLTFTPAPNNEPHREHLIKW